MIKLIKNGRRPLLPYRFFASAPKNREDEAAIVSPSFEKDDIDEIFSP
jgi:hypothetical protein